LVGSFRYHAITPITLTAGKSYYAAAVTGTDAYLGFATLTIDPSITFLGFAIFGDTQTTSSLQCPNGVASLPGFPGDFGPGFLIGSSNLVTPKTPLTDPPTVTVEARKVTLTFTAFSGVGTLKNRSLDLDSSNFAPVMSLARSGRAKKPKANFEYVAEVQRTADENGAQVKKDIRKLTSKKNQIVLNNLKPGSYTAKYRVRIFTGKGSSKKVIGQTKFSPAATFSVQ
jgi:hypothetical protein